MNPHVKIASLVRNAFSFPIAAGQVDLGICFQEQVHLKRIPISYFSKICHDKPLLERAQDYVWIAPQVSPADARFSIDLQKEPSLAAWYYEHRFYTLLKHEFRITRRSFTGAFQYWEEIEEEGRSLFLRFHKYRLHFDLSPNHREIYLSLSYDGESKVLRKHIDQLVSQYRLDTRLFKAVIFEKECQPYQRISESVRSQLNQVYPILRREIAEWLDIRWENNPDRYKLKKAYEQIDHFRRTYLQHEELRQWLGNLHWMEVKEKEMGLIKDRQKTLVFGRQQASTDMYRALTHHGPYQLPPHRHYQTFIIYSKQDARAKEILEKHLLGEKGYKQFQEFSHLPMVYHPELNYEILDLKKMEHEIKAFIHHFQKEDEVVYFAFYISPYAKYGRKPEEQIHYYKIKEVLLKRRIVSQAIVGAKLDKNINFWIPNMSISMVAKLGGIPWKLDRQGEKELIVGFGAFKSSLRKKPYIGSSFCFDNEGHFQEFDCWQEMHEWALVGSLIQAIRTYQKKNQGISRIVIHYYKALNKKEFRQVEDLIDRLKLSIPVIVVRINSSFEPKELIVDPQHRYKLPLNGSYYHLQYQDYLLYINEREKESTQEVKKAGYPLKVSLQSNRAGLFEDKALVQTLMQQLYDFSLLHWRSINQPRLPVTLAYPQYLARIFPYFEAEVLQDIGRTRLWFL